MRRSAKADAQRRGDHGDQRFGGRLMEVVEGDEALAEPVAAPSASEDEGHRRSRDAAIGMTYQALEDPGFAAPGAGGRGGRDPFFVGAAQQHRHQARLIEQARSAQLLDQCEIALVVGGRPAARQRRPKRIGDIADEAMEHRGHERPLLLGQALVGIEEKVGADRGQPVASRGARGRELVRCISSDRPFLRHHQAGLIEFLLTSRQLGGRCLTCWTMKKDSAA